MSFSNDKSTQSRSVHISQVTSCDHVMSCDGEMEVASTSGCEKPWTVCARPSRPLIFQGRDVAKYKCLYSHYQADTVLLPLPSLPLSLSVSPLPASLSLKVVTEQTTPPSFLSPGVSSVSTRLCHFL